MLSRLLHLTALSSALVLSAAGARSQGSLLVVDAAGGPGSIATQISGAIDLAHDGDVLLVRAGSYLPFTIEARTLVIVAEPGAEVVVGDPDDQPPDFTALVRGIAANQVVVLEGLTFRGGWTDDEVTDALRLEDCAGQVWIQDCKLESVEGFASPKYGSLQAIDCRHVLVIRTAAYFSGIPFQFKAGSGLIATRSRIFAHESSFAAGPGADGAILDASFLFAEETSILGGIPMTYTDMFGQCTSLLAGGTGLEFATFTSQAELLESSAKAVVFPWCAVNGGDTNVPGLIHTIPGPALSFSATSPTLDGQATDFTLHGPPGDLGLVLVATSLQNVAWFPKFKGGLATGTPFFVLLGALPPSGELVVPFQLGDMLTPGTASTVFLQGAVMHATGGAQLGDPATWTAYEP